MNTSKVEIRPRRALNLWLKWQALTTCEIPTNANQGMQIHKGGYCSEYLDLECLDTILAMQNILSRVDSSISDLPRSSSPDS